MAKLERTLNGDFNQIIKKIETGILNGSMSASPCILLERSAKPTMDTDPYGKTCFTRLRSCEGVIRRS